MRGIELLHDIEFLEDVLEGINYDHERMDGRGYPEGLTGDRIPEFARAIAVADAFDSMTSTRSYRHARTVAEAVAELRRCKGSQFDPAMVDAMVASLEKHPWRHAPKPEQADATGRPPRSTTTTRRSSSAPPGVAGERNRRAPGYLRGLKNLVGMK